MTKPSVEKGARERLLDAAFTVLEERGPEALRARALTAEIGTSTMALYTHFGGMPGLVDALIREGLVRFATHIRQVPETDDPMTNLIGRGLAYGEFAVRNSQLYRLMFGLTDGHRLRGLNSSSDAPRGTWAMAEGVDAFSILLGSVERVIEAGRLRPQDANTAATQILSSTHGFVLLVIGGFIGDVVEAMEDVMVPMSINLMVALGDEREATERSMVAALAGRA